MPFMSVISKLEKTLTGNLSVEKETANGQVRYTRTIDLRAQTTGRLGGLERRSEGRGKVLLKTHPHSQ